MGTVESESGATRLRDAALVLFGEHGYEGTSVRAIAERAGVTAGLVLHHYGSKQGLREAVDQYVLESVRNAWTELADISEGTDHLALRQRGFQVLFQQHPYMGRYLRRALLDPDDHRPWLDVAAAREKQGALTGALEALSRARRLGDPADACRVSMDRVRMRLN